MNHLLKLSDLTSEEITAILNLGDQLKYEKKHGIPHNRLAGKTLGMIFQKSSTLPSKYSCGTKRFLTTSFCSILYPASRVRITSLRITSIPERSIRGSGSA